MALSTGAFVKRGAAGRLRCCVDAAPDCTQLLRGNAGANEHDQNEDTDHDSSLHALPIVSNWSSAA